MSTILIIDDESQIRLLLQKPMCRLITSS